MPNPRLRDLGIVIGSLAPGDRNSITDVDGVRVGHVDLSEGSVQTGCTAIRLHDGHPFREKLAAAVHVINGFGKSVGLLQIDELGTLETPIILTNTLAVGTAATALVRHMLKVTPEIGATTGTVNPVVLECNDGTWLNDIRGLHLREEHVLSALGQTSVAFTQGNVGAGTGMSCYGLAGGIGSASRRIDVGTRTHTLGVLSLCNMGSLPDLQIGGRAVGRSIADRLGTAQNDPAGTYEHRPREQGSIIVIVATDLPVDPRQLRRIATRTSAGIARTGTHFGSGSGDIALAVSTAESIPHAMAADPVLERRVLHEDALDPVFRATIEATEEAIIDCLLAATPRIGKQGNRRGALSDFVDLLAER